MRRAFGTIVCHRQIRAELEGGVRRAGRRRLDEALHAADFDRLAALLRDSMAAQAVPPAAQGVLLSRMAQAPGR